jgi:hypothetical protein
VKAFIGAAIAILAVAVPAVASSSPSSGCSATTGVTVIVDFTHFRAAGSTCCAVFPRTG